MSLLQDNSYKAPKLSRKHMLYIFGGLLVLLVAAQVIQKMTGAGKSARELEYTENINVPATASDSLLIDSMYTQLTRIYDRINTFNFDTVLEFGAKPASLNADFEVKMIAYDLLQFMFDTAQDNTGVRYESELGANSYFSSVSETMGQSDFIYPFTTRDFDKAFACNARYFLSDRYVTVLVPLSYAEPVYHETINEFDSGLFEGAVMLFDISTQQVVAYMRFTSTNSQEVQSKKYVKGSENKAIKADLEQNVRNQVNHFHTKYLGQ